MIDRDLAGFLAQGLGIHIGARDERLEPEGARAIAARIEDDGRHLVLFVADVAATRLLPHLRSNGQAAMTFARPVDDRAVQVKGTVVDIRSATEAERPFVAAQWDGFLDQLERIGIPRSACAAWITWPAVAIRVRVTAIFDQTPGTRAGTALA